MTGAARPFDPPTELIVAAVDITLCANTGEVTQDKRARLLLAAEQLPTEGLDQPWYALRDIAIRYVRDHTAATFAPRFDFGALVNNAVNAGVHRTYRWQETLS